MSVSPNNALLFAVAGAVKENEEGEGRGETVGKNRTLLLADNSNISFSIISNQRVDIS